MGLGLLVCLVVLPIALAVMKKEPAEVSQTPYRRPARGLTAPASFRTTETSPREVFRSWGFFFVAMSYFTCGFHDFFFLTQFIPFATDVGLTNQHASNIQGVAGLLSALGLLTFPILVEKAGHALPLAFMFLLRAVAFALLTLSSGETAISAAAWLMGFTLMATAPLAAAMTGDYYGVRNIGLITGVILWVHHTGGALGAFLGGLAHDLTESYEVMFLASLLTALTGVATGLGVRPPKRTADLSAP